MVTGAKILWYSISIIMCAIVLTLIQYSGWSISWISSASCLWGAVFCLLMQDTSRIGEDL